jgi:Tfp pilus assembly protein PilO
LTARAQPQVWRRPGLVGLGLLLALNLAVALVFTMPRGLAERSVEARVRTLQAEVEERRVELERADQRQQLLADNARDAHSLVDSLIGTREATLVPILSEIEGAAREFGLALGSYNLEPEDVDDTPLTRLKITVPVEGAYTALVGFLRRLEHAKTFVTVDELKLSDKSKGSQGRTTALSLSLSAYVRAAPGEPRGGQRGR